VARDPFERIRFKPTIPDSAADNPRFGRVIETTKNAFLWELREFFDQAAQTTERLQERPRIEKYQFGFGQNLDPYETVVQILRKYADEREALPHIAVLATTGSWKPLGFGVPLLASVQELPRIETAAEPFALLTGPIETAADGFTVAGPAVGRMTLASAIGGFGAGLVGEWITFVGMADGNNNGTFLITAVDPGGFTLEFINSSGVAGSPATYGSFAVGDATATLEIYSAPATPQSGPNMDMKTDRVVFRPADFPTGAPITAAAAADIVRVYNGRALYTRAETVDLGGGNTGVRFTNGGKKGGDSTPNFIEVGPNTSTALATAFGFVQSSGTAIAGDDIVVGASSGLAILEIAAGAFTAALIGSSIVIDGATTATNNGRFEITGLESPTRLVYRNKAYRPEPFEGTWFVGAHDDWTNPLRVPKNRYELTWALSVEIQVLSEDENERTDLTDLVLSFLTTYLKDRYFTLMGRSIFDESVPDEFYNIIIKPGVREGPEQELPRPDDQRDKVYTAMFSVDVQTTMYIDREVEYPTVPGAPWTVTDDDLTYDVSLPGTAETPTDASQFTDD